MMIAGVVSIFFSGIKLGFNYSQSSISSFSCPSCQYHNEHLFSTGRQATGEEIFKR